MESCYRTGIGPHLSIGTAITAKSFQIGQEKAKSVAELHLHKDSAPTKFCWCTDCTGPTDSWDSRGFNSQMVTLSQHQPLVLTSSAFRFNGSMGCSTHWHWHANNAHRACNVHNALNVASLTIYFNISDFAWLLSRRLNFAAWFETDIRQEGCSFRMNVAIPSKQMQAGNDLRIIYQDFGVRVCQGVHMSPAQSCSSLSMDCMSLWFKHISIYLAITVVGIYTKSSHLTFAAWGSKRSSSMDGLFNLWYLGHLEASPGPAGQMRKKHEFMGHDLWIGCLWMLICCELAFTTFTFCLRLLTPLMRNHAAAKVSKILRRLAKRLQKTWSIANSSNSLATDSWDCSKYLWRIKVSDPTPNQTRSNKYIC